MYACEEEEFLVICNYSICYKGLEHPQALVPAGCVGPET